MTIVPGSVFYIVGPNGAGKSALLSVIIQQLPMTLIKRISAHRQNWLSGDGATFAPFQRHTYESSILTHSRNHRARYIEEHAGERIGLAISSFISKENHWHRELIKACEASGESVESYKRKNPSPLQDLNEILRQGALSVQIEITDDDLLKGCHGDTTLIGVSKLSDGERNAILLATDVVSARAGTIFLVDEPERHLHRSITEPLLAALFKRRPDCAFIIGTHEIALPTVEEGASTLILRSCTWAGEEPQSFDLELLEPRSDLPQDLRAAILGSRKRILFVEGDETSLDRRLYGILFPTVSVTPKGGCPNVIEAVRGLRSAENLHWVEAFGLVDRDNRPEEEVEKLATEHIHALSVCSIESLYFGRVAREAMAKQQAEHQGKDASKLLEACEAAALKALSDPNTMRNLCALRCERKARDSVFGCLPKAKDLLEGTATPITLDFETVLNDEIEVFESLVRDKKLDELMTRYQLRKSGCYGAISTKLLFPAKENYENAVVALCQRDASFCAALRKVLGPLTNELISEEEPERAIKTIEKPVAAA
ncbi:DUF4435 domain-containing protein [Rhodospirillaceae bacterium SYSU D60014]|uniref:DUF4435 domain-containing protein n=1 Tax=Virgifigura deserti TaxID=2268457 RepID=UPI0013C49D9D